MAGEIGDEGNSRWLEPTAEVKNVVETEAHENHIAMMMSKSCLCRFILSQGFAFWVKDVLEEINVNVWSRATPSK